jgi:hypothetical protein
MSFPNYGSPSRMLRSSTGFSSNWYLPVPVIVEVEEGAEASPGAARRREINEKLDAFLKTHGATVMDWDVESAEDGDEIFQAKTAFDNCPSAPRPAWLLRWVNLQRRKNPRLCLPPPTHLPWRVSKLWRHPTLSSQSHGRDLQDGLGLRGIGRERAATDDQPGISRAGQHNVVCLMCRVFNGGKNVFVFKIGIIGQNLLVRGSRAQKLQNVGDSHSHTTKAWTTTALSWFDGDALEQFHVHV